MIEYETVLLGITYMINLDGGLSVVEQGSVILSLQ